MLTMIWIDQEVQPAPFMQVHHWLMLCNLGIVNVHWYRNNDRFSNNFTFKIRRILWHQETNIEFHSLFQMMHKLFSILGYAMIKTMTTKWVPCRCSHVVTTKVTMTKDTFCCLNGCWMGWRRNVGIYGIHQTKASRHPAGGSVISVKNEHISKFCLKF